MAVALANSIASNYSVMAAMQAMLDQLNLGPGWLRLFANSFTPTYSSPISAFIEANFGGYEPINLSGVFLPPTKQVDGFYVSNSPRLTFQNTSPFDSTVQGFFVTARSNLLWCGNFVAPTTIGGPSSFYMLLTWQAIDLSLQLT
jgi:hypothetical protein